MNAGKKGYVLLLDLVPENTFDMMFWSSFEKSGSRYKESGWELQIQGMTEP